MIERKREERKLRKPNQIYLLVSIILFSSSLFPSNQTDPKDMRNIWVGTINK
jgi:hypothetical protein